LNESFAMQLPKIILTEQDSDRIARLLEILPYAQREAISALEHELARAEVVDSADVPHDVVTMYSRVVFEDMETGRRSEALLVYPHDVAGLHGVAISVLAPVGSALLGMRAGQSIEWRMPSGKLKRYRVVEVAHKHEGSDHGR
jgi:regulator of nucleoside diphosphate kinase